MNSSLGMISLLCVSLWKIALHPLILQQSERGAERACNWPEKYFKFLWLCDPLLLSLRPVAAGETGCGVLLQLERQG